MPNSHGEGGSKCAEKACTQDSSYLSLPNYLYGLSMLRIASCIVELLPGTPQHQEKKAGQPGTYATAPAPLSTA